MWGGTARRAAPPAPAPPPPPAPAPLPCCPRAAWVALPAAPPLPASLLPLLPALEGRNSWSPDSNSMLPKYPLPRGAAALRLGAPPVPALPPPPVLLLLAWLPASPPAAAGSLPSAASSWLSAASPSHCMPSRAAASQLQMLRAADMSRMPRKGGQPLMDTGTHTTPPAQGTGQQQRRASRGAGSCGGWRHVPADRLSEQPGPGQAGAKGPRAAVIRRAARSARTADPAAAHVW